MYSQNYFVCIINKSKIFNILLIEISKRAGTSTITSISCLRLWEIIRKKRKLNKDDKIHKKNRWKTESEKKEQKENKKSQTFQHILNFFLYYVFFSLTDIQTKKIFIKYMLIDQRNLHKKKNDNSILKSCREIHIFNLM